MIDHRVEYQKFCQTIDGYIAQLQALVLFPSQASLLVLNKLTEVGQEFKALANTITLINIEKPLKFWLSTKTILMPINGWKQPKVYLNCQWKRN